MCLSACLLVCFWVCEYACMGLCSAVGQINDERFKKTFVLSWFLTFNWLFALHSVTGNFSSTFVINIVIACVIFYYYYNCFCNCNRCYSCIHFIFRSFVKFTHHTFKSLVHSLTKCFIWFVLISHMLSQILFLLTSLWTIKFLVS